MTYERKVFRDNIRTAIRESGLTQEQFAQMVGVTLASVSGWCRGLAEPKGFQLVLIAQKTDRPAEWFFTDHDAKPGRKAVAA